MSPVYITNTISSANPGADLYTAMAPAFTTAGYTLVDTVVISTRTHKIWKSAAANNTIGKDWYLDVAYPTTGSGDLKFMIMEYFDPATDLVYRAPYIDNMGTGSLETTYYTAIGGTGYSLEHSLWPLNASTSAPFAIFTNTTGFGYWISITGNRVAGVSSAFPTAMVYVGCFTPTARHLTAAGAYAYPLVQMFSPDSSAGAVSAPTAGQTTAALTRVPKSTTVQWGAHVAVQPEYTAWDMAKLPSGALGIVPSYALSPLTVRSNHVSYTTGHYGYLIDAGSTPAISTVNRGDTVTIGADTWVLTTAGTTSGLSYAFKAV